MCRFVVLLCTSFFEKSNIISNKSDFLFKTVGCLVEQSTIRECRRRCVCPFFPKPAHECHIIDMKGIANVFAPHPPITAVMSPRLVIAICNLYGMFPFLDIISSVVCHFPQLLTIFVAGRPCDSNIAGLFYVSSPRSDRLPE